MTNQKFTLTIISLVFLLTSCGIWRVPNSTKEDFTYCYTGERTGLDTLIQTDGHYLFTLTYSRQEGSPPEEVEKSTQYKVGFYNDGTFIYRYECGEGFWGRYIVVSDTIKAQFISPPGSMSWIKSEAWFLIRSSEVIEQIVLKYRDKVTSEYLNNYNKSKNYMLSQGQFVSENDLPDPNYSWLKKESWYWCNKDLYNNWIKE